MKPKLLLIIFLAICLNTYAQQSLDSALSKIDPEKWSTYVEKKMTKLEERIIAKTNRALYKLEKQERKLSKVLAAADSNDAKNIFLDAEKKYEQLRNKLGGNAAINGGRLSGEYLPYLDSLKGSLSFLNTNKSLLTPLHSSSISDAWKEFNQFQGKLQQADAVKEYIKQREQQLSELLTHYTSLADKVSKAMAKYNKEMYYYSQQIREYKEMFRDPDKLLRKTLVELNKLPAFQQFMKEHSELAGLFSLPGDYGSTQALIGLQTRGQVQQAMSAQLGSSTNVGQVFGQQIQSAQSQLDKFKQKLNALGAGSGDIEMPNFKPNNQRTKTFLKRLEFGTNIQNTRANALFPTTTDLGLSIGYHIDDKKIVGIGIAGKIGWGKDLHHVMISGQGVALRSFADIKIKNSFYGSGGFEYDYQEPFNEVRQLYNFEKWTKSGLIGITKIISIKNRVFKNTKIQLLWDFLNTLEKYPKISQPMKFRIGYGF